MSVAVAGESSDESSASYDRLRELKAFDESKSGVKGVVDAGITKVPPMFIRSPEELASDVPISSHTPTSLPMSGKVCKLEGHVLFCVMGPEPLDPQELPLVCRNITIEFSEKVQILGIVLLELLSEALGLKPGQIKSMGCAEGHIILSHYYPGCPEPELTMGTTRHSDPVNIEDLLQLISNDRFVSVEHRVLANRFGPRVSIATFFSKGVQPTPNLYGPIKELLSEKNPPKYRETSVAESAAYYNIKGLNGTSALLHFRI
ncbi:1-aminocyclopropane-1-carboxylate oxidase-like protein [Quillaja saponaria]|uniref:1-aminocyclopropane-1-carboxylate oxidase-like protein n=1 Tax=Quillaja saponaria TaxID=32244 RepID=A0AAD7QFH4_QUISA|nr:1-aminocyclopropane-1-carboxylate oxidase-like protein [Quillaja saponaria]